MDFNLIISFGITSLIIVIISSFFYGKGGFRNPMTGRFIPKWAGFVVYIILIFVLGYVSVWLQKNIEEIIISGPIFALVGAAVLFYLFDFVHYKR